MSGNADSVGLEVAHSFCYLVVLSNHVLGVSAKTKYRGEKGHLSDLSLQPDDGIGNFILLSHQLQGSAILYWAL